MGDEEKEIIDSEPDTDTLVVKSETVKPDIKLKEVTYETIDGFDDCIVGVVDNFNGTSRLCYDKIKMIKKLISQGATVKNASETLHQYCFPLLEGKISHTGPCFLDRYADVGIVGYDNYPPMDDIEELVDDCGG